MTSPPGAPRVTRLDKKPLKKKAKKPSLLKEADRLFGILIRSRGACEHCGKTFELQCAHGLPRSYRKVRHDERNAFALCKSDHVFFTHRPLEWTDWLVAKWGQPLYDEMVDTALHGPRANLKATIESLKTRLAMEGIDA